MHVPECSKKERKENNEGKHLEYFENDGPTGEPGIQEEEEEKKRKLDEIGLKPKGIRMNVRIRSTYIGRLLLLWLCDGRERKNVGQKERPNISYHG